MKKKLTLILLLFSSAAFTQVYSYTNDVGGAPNSVASNCSATNLTRVNGASLPTFPCGSGFSSDKLTQSPTYTPANTAVEFTLTPLGNNNLSLSSLTANLRRSVTFGANLARFAYRIGGSGSFTDQGIDVNPNSGGCGATAQFTWVFSSTLTVPKASSITFRVYFFDAGGVQGTAQILNMSVAGSVLPIELIAFEAKNTADAITLYWSTATEKDNAYFDIERADASLQFESIGRVNGAGSTTMRQDYQFSDKSPNPGDNFYRFKQVDFDGRYQYGPVVAKVWAENAALQLSPVPVTDRLKISLPDSPLENAQYVIYDYSGQIVRASTLLEGSNGLEVEVSALPGGMYVLQLQAERSIYRARFLKM
jgi:hypothetical protein